MPTTFEASPVALPQERQSQSRRETTTLNEARPDLETVLQAIRCDCRHQSERYLDEISVPLGGE